jgi:hypothetical protein
MLNTDLGLRKVSNMSRKITNKLLEMLAEGLLSKDTVIIACFKYMSEDEVADMARINGFLEEEEEEEEEEEV